MTYNELSSSLALSASSVIFPVDSPANHVSYVGTASWSVTASHALTASTAITASYITSSGVDGPHGMNSVLTSSYSITSSYAATSSFGLSSSYADTASYVNNLTQSVNILGNLHVTGEITASLLYVQIITSSISYITGSTIFGSDINNNTHQITGSTSITGSLTVNGVKIPTTSSLQDVTTIGGASSSSINLTGPVTASNLAATGSLYGTASWAVNAVTASYVATASYVTSSAVEGPLGMNSILTASYAVSSSLAETASLAITASYITSSGVQGPLGMNSVLSASYAITASFVESSSYALSASYAVSSSLAETASLAITASYITSSAVEGPLGMNSVLSSSHAITASYIDVTGSGVLVNWNGSTLQLTGSASSIDNLQDVTTRGNSTTSSVLIGTGSAVKPGIALGTASLVNGQSVRALADYTHAEGFDTTAVGTYSHTEGAYTLATGWASHAEGYGIAMGSASHAEGGAYAIGEASHAEGYNSTSIGPWSHAAGAEMYSYATYSFAHGKYGQTSSAAQTALWVVGDGDSVSRRHNLIEAYASSSTGLGKIQVTGSIIATQVPVGFVGTASWAINALSASSPVYSKEIHVSSGSGDDTLGNGTLLNPYKTLTKAFTVVGNTGEQIIVHPGTYTESPTLSALNVTITGNGMVNGGIVYLNGTLTVASANAASSVRISGIAMDSLTHNNVSRLYLDGCKVYNTLTKSGNATYGEYVNTELQCAGGILVTGTGTLVIQGNKQAGLVVNNAAAIVTVKDSVSCVLPSVLNGTLNIDNSYVFATTAGGSAIQSLGTLQVTNTGIYDSTGVPTKITAVGAYGYANSLFNLTGSTLVGVSLNLTPQFQSISSSNGANTVGFFGTASWAQNTLTASYVATASWALNAVTASHALTASYYVEKQTLQDVTTLGAVSTSSVVLSGSFTGSLYGVSYTTGSLLGTASFANNVTLLGKGITVNGMQLTASVLSVNGIFPDVNGNISSPLVQTATGTSASLSTSGSAPVSASLPDGLVWIISGDPNPSLNGDSYIWVSSSQQFQPLSSFDTAAGDARYLMLNAANSPMSGALNMGGFKITSLANPTLSTDAVNLGTLTASLLPYLLTSSFNAYTGSNVSTFAGTSSLALTASYVLSSSYALSASYSVSSSYALTASYAIETQTLQDVTTLGNRTTSSIVIGTSNTFANGSQSFALGTASIASAPWSMVNGDRLVASGTSSHAEGLGSTAAGLCSHAEGDSTRALAYVTHTEGTYTTAVGIASHTEGQFTITTATALYSHAEGQSTTAAGLVSHAEGIFTRAFATGSHTEGNLTTTTGLYSHAEGQSTTATGGAAHAEGFGNIAIGGHSHAEGRTTTAVGDGSHTEGFGTIANGAYQHVMGLYNLQVVSSGSFIIGNGTSNASRSNLLYASGSQVQVTGSVDVTGQYLVNGVPLSGGGNLQQTLTLGNSASISLQLSSSLFIQSGSAVAPNYLYFGDATTNGSFRMYLSGSGALAVEKRVAGAWVNSGTFN